MWKTIKRCSMVVSIALNVAFVGIWIAYAAASLPSPWQTGKSITQQQKIWCPLHRELDVTEEQWEQCLSRFALSQEAVRIDAENLGIDASIIAGRIRKERGNYTILNDLVGQGQVRSQFEEAGNDLE